MGVPLNIDWQQILLHMFNLIILTGGLYFLLYQPVTAFMKKRQEYYAGLEADAQAKLQEAEQKVREADETLSGMQAEAVFVVRRIAFGLSARFCSRFFFHILLGIGFILFFSLEFPTLEEIPRLSGRASGFRRTGHFLSDENTTCYVRLNIESSFVGLLRDVHGVLLSDEAWFPPWSYSDFAKL